MARTPSVYLHVKIDQKMRDSIDSAILNGEYHDIHEFARKAFKTQLDPRRELDRTKSLLKELLQTDPEIRKLIHSESKHPIKDQPSLPIDEERLRQDFKAFIDFSGFPEKTIYKGLAELEEINDQDVKLLFLMLEHSLLYGFITRLKQMQPDEKKDSKALLATATDFAGRDRALLSMFNKESGK